MEQQAHNQTEIGKEVGFNRYKFLKNLEFETLTPDEKKEIESYEARHEVTPDQLAYKKSYVERLTTEIPTKDFVFTKENLWKLFIAKYNEVNKKDFEQTTESLSNLKAIFYYFLKDDAFLQCENLHYITKPDFNKGLLIIGNFGNGKTSVMKTFEEVFKGIKNYHFKGYNANEVVKMFEQIKADEFGIDLTRKDFDRKMTKGTVYFDDVKTEREASNYGKVNLFKEILEMRNTNNSKTFITCNFRDGYPNNIEEALNEFSVKYGERVYDRIYEMFNIIEFKGKSFRV